MSSKKTKILLNLDKELLDQIEDYRYENRIPSRTEAIRLLLKKALEEKAISMTNKYPTGSISGWALTTLHATFTTIFV